MNTTGKNIRQLRQGYGWSQGEVAKRLNISIPAFSKIETGSTDINIARLNQLAHIFNVPAGKIIAEEGQNPNSVYDEQIGSLKMKLVNREKDILELQQRLIALYEIAKNRKR